MLPLWSCLRIHNSRLFFNCMCIDLNCANYTWKQRFKEQETSDIHSKNNVCYFCTGGIEVCFYLQEYVFSNRGINTRGNNTINGTAWIIFWMTTIKLFFCGPTLKKLYIHVFNYRTYILIIYLPVIKKLFDLRHPSNGDFEWPRVWTISGLKRKQILVHICILPYQTYWF